MAFCVDYGEIARKKAQAEAKAAQANNQGQCEEEEGDIK